MILASDWGYVIRLAATRLTICTRKETPGGSGGVPPFPRESRLSK